MEKIENILGTVNTTLGKVFRPDFWNCSKPITVSTAKTPEELVSDVKKAERVKIPKINLKGFDEKYNKLKNLNAEDFRLTLTTIPNYILVCTGAGVLAEVLAYVVKIPWYLPVVVGVCAIGVFVMKFQEIKQAEEY